MSSKIDFTKNVLVVISGASQGIGRCLAIEAAKKFKNRIDILLIARSESGLKQTELLVKEANKNVNVTLAPLDLTHPNETDLESIIGKSLNFKPDLAVIFHNVGQVGALKPALELNDPKVWEDYYHLNVFSVALLNSIFVKKVQANCESTKICLINITSLCGRQPFKDMALYGSGKAARELYFRVFAEEQENIIVLNYSPGPVDTPMIAEVIDNLSNAEMRSVFVDMKEKNSILTTDQTVNKLYDILALGDFKSGATIDYFDRI